MLKMSNSPLKTDELVVVQPTKRRYATLQETSGEECESWYYFLRYDGNEEAIKHLQKQLDSIEWYTLDDLSTFVIETDFLISEQTAKEMTKIDLNPTSFHRKFDGKLKMIDLGLKDKYSTEKKMSKVFEKLGYGDIEQYIDEEDIDPEDIANNEDEEEDNKSSSESESETSEEETESDSASDSPKKKVKNLPNAVKQPIPRVAQAKQYRHRK